MSAKAILVFCAQALFVQSALSQCTSRAAVAADPAFIAPAAGLAAPYGSRASFAYDGLALGAPYGTAARGLAGPYGFAGSALAAPCGLAAPAMDFTPTSGGGLPVSSASAIAPVGLSVASENVYEGLLAAAGELPFVGTVAVEGVLPTAGAGAVNHACGNGINAMVSETKAFAPAYSTGYGSAYGTGYGSGYGTGYGSAYAGAYDYAPAAAITPAAAIAPGLGYRAGWAGSGCGCAI